MNLNQLQTLVEGAITANTLVISADQLDSPNIATLFRDFLPDARLEIRFAVVETQAEKIVVSGQMIPIFSIANAAVLAEFSIINNQAEVKLTLSQLPVYWRFSDSFPALGGSLFDSFQFANSELILESLPGSTLPQDFQTQFGYPSSSAENGAIIKRGLAFQAQLALDGPFLLLSWLLNDGQPFQISGPIALRDGIPSLLLQATITRTVSLGQFQLPITFQLGSVWYYFEDTARTMLPTTFARLSARIVYSASVPALEIPIAAQFYSSDLSILTFDSDLTQVSRVGLSELSGLMQSGSVSSLIPQDFPALDNIALNRLSLTASLAKKELSNILLDIQLLNDKGWEIIPGMLSFRDMHVVFNASNLANSDKRLVTADVFGKVDIADGAIDGYITLPYLAFTCELEEGSKIEITKLVKSLLSTDISGLPTINCTQLLITGDVPTASYSMFTAIESDWSFTIDSTAITFKNITLGIEHIGAQNENESSTTGRIGATIDIGDEVVLILAEYAGSQRGWTFVGQISRINFTDLTEQFLKAVSLPAALPDVEIENIYMAVTPQTGAFSFRGESNTVWEIIPETFVISRAGIDAERDDVGTLSVELTGSVDVLDLAGLAAYILEALSVTVHFPSVSLSNVQIAIEPIEGRFQVSGSLSVGQKLSMKDVGHAFGSTIAVPSAIENLTIEHFTLAFNTQPSNKDFFFTCTSRIPLDQAGQDTVDITVTIDVKEANGSYSLDAAGHIELSVEGLDTPLIFDLRFANDKTSTIFIAAYHHSGGTQRLNLANLVRSVVHTDSTLADLIPDGLTIDLKDIFFAYIKDASATETTSQQGRFLFGLDLGASINLSQLPLVGQVFAPDQTLAVENLRLLVASRALSSGEVTAFNALLPAGVAALPVAAAPASQAGSTPPALQQGVTLAAALRMGGAAVPLTLPIAADTTASSTTGTAAGADAALAVVDNTRWFTVQRGFGPVYFARIGVQYKDGAAWFLLDATLATGGLSLSLEGLAVGSPLDHFAPSFTLRGLALAYQSDTLTIAGALLRVARADLAGHAYDEYDGAALLKTQKLTLSALGSYAYLNGYPSLFVYATLDAPIGGPAFFFVTGLAAGFGYNRALRSPAIDQVAQFPLVQAAVAGPRPSLGNSSQLMQELTRLGQYMPPASGQFFFALGITFTSFKLIDSVALLTVSIGDQVAIEVLGLSTMIAPTPIAGAPAVSPIAEVRMAFKATFLPAQGFLGVSAQLTSDSYILSRACRLTGGFAFYAWFAGEHAGDFVYTLGGYHPRFTPPAHYPRVPRLGINWQVNSQLSIKGQGYYALTSSALMVGGQLQATWESGNLKVWFNVGADFLLAWKPYYYEAAAYVQMRVDYTWEFWGKHHISVDVGADLRLWGPEFSGTAHVKLWIISFDVAFGAAAKPPAPIDWPTFKASFLPYNKRLASAAAIPDNQITACSIAAQEGLTRAIPMDGGADMWVIDPLRFVLVAQSTVPSSKAHIKQDLVFNQCYFDGAGAQARPLPFRADSSTAPLTQATSASARRLGGLGIGPMEVATGGLSSSLTISISYGGGGVEHEFSYTPILKSVPAALWGGRLKPDLQGPSVIADTLAGFEIRPNTPPQPGAAVPLPVAWLQATQTSVAKAYDWTAIADGQPQSGDDAARRASIGASLASAAATAARAAVLAALKVEAGLDMGDNVAGMFFVAPQLVSF